MRAGGASRRSGEPLGLGAAKLWHARPRLCRLGMRLGCNEPVVCKNTRLQRFDLGRLSSLVSYSTLACSVFKQRILFTGQLWDHIDRQRSKRGPTNVRQQNTTSQHGATAKNTSKSNAKTLLVATATASHHQAKHHHRACTPHQSHWKRSQRSPYEAFAAPLWMSGGRLVTRTTFPKERLRTRRFLPGGRGWVSPRTPGRQADNAGLPPRSKAGSHLLNNLRKNVCFLHNPDKKLSPHRHACDWCSLLNGICHTIKANGRSAREPRGLLEWLRTSSGPRPTCASPWRVATMKTKCVRAGMDAVRRALGLGRARVFSRFALRLEGGIVWCPFKRCAEDYYRNADEGVAHPWPREAYGASRPCSAIRSNVKTARRSSTRNSRWRMNTRWIHRGPHAVRPTQNKRTGPWRPTRRHRGGKGKNTRHHATAWRKRRAQQVPGGPHSPPIPAEHNIRGAAASVERGAHRRERAGHQTRKLIEQRPLEPCATSRKNHGGHR